MIPRMSRLDIFYIRRLRVRQLYGFVRWRTGTLIICDLRDCRSVTRMYRICFKARLGCEGCGFLDVAIVSHRQWLLVPASGFDSSCNYPRWYFIASKTWRRGSVANNVRTQSHARGFAKSISRERFLGCEAFWHGLRASIEVRLTNQKQAPARK